MRLPSQLCADKDIKKVPGDGRSSQSPGGNDMTLDPAHPAGRSRKDNLNVVLDAGWITKAKLCQDVPAGSAAACG